MLYPASRVASRVAQLGRAISRDFAGRTVDVVIVLESSFVFAADLMRRISQPVVCHFVRADISDVKHGGFDRREDFFSQAPRLWGRGVFVVGGVVKTGGGQGVLCWGLLETAARWIRLCFLCGTR